MNKKLDYKDWEIDFESLLEINDNIKVKIVLVYPNFEDFIHLKIKERIPAMRRIQRANFQKVKI